MNATQTLKEREEQLLELRRLADRALPHLIERTRAMVERETPSQDKAAIDALTALVAGWCRDLAAEIIIHPNEMHADSLEVRFGCTSSQTKPVLLLGHLDTVWEQGTLAGMPWAEDADRIAGPGVLDMKAGVAMALTAIELLAKLEAASLPVILLLHGDEEIGSPASRSLTESVAERCSRVFVLEPGEGPGGAYKTARKGVGRYRLEVEGVAAHAGVDFGKGHSAIVELGRQLVKVGSLSDPSRGLTVNPGVIGGGTVSNVVAAHAWVEIDVRVTSMEDALGIERKLLALTPEDPGCVLKVSGGLNRPPMVRTPAVAALFQQAESAAGIMALGKLEEAATGGASDGNFTAAIGVPTLDGMGAVGGGAHAPHEHLLKAYLAPRTALLASMLINTTV